MPLMRFKRHAVLLIVIFLMPTSLLYTRAERAAQADNLVADSGFEAGAADENWYFCGGARLADAQAAGTTDDMVRTGRYALRMGQPVDDSCGNPPFGPSQIAAEDVTIPSDAEDVTLSFWYSPTGDWPVGEVLVQLSTKPTNYVGSVVSVNSLKMEDLTPGWQLFRQNLTGDALEAVRGQTLYLSFWVEDKGQPDWNWAIYFDDIRVTPTWERTEGAPLPADLGGDGAQPLLVLGQGQTNDQFGIQRMDTDGGNRVVIRESAAQPNYLSWSPDGSQIAFSTERPFPSPPSSDDNFPALVSDVFLLNADGSGLRQIYKTTGVEGQKERPLGCIPTNSCADSGRDAIDAKVEDLEWSPDGREMLPSICLEPRWYNGDKEIRGCSYHLARAQVPADDTVVDITQPKFIDVARDASWVGNSQLLFQRPGSIGTEPLPSGIWQVEASRQPPQPQLVQGYLTEFGGSNTLDLRPSPELEPTWAPDARHYVTYRPAQGVHYAEKVENDLTFSALRVNYAIMLHDIQDTAATRQLLYVDQGTLVARPTWSPDGRYLLYVVLADNEQQADIWWLDVATGATGQITNDGVSYQVDWLPTHDFASTQPQPSATPTSAGPAPTSNPALGQSLYLPVVKRSGTGGRWWQRRGQPHRHASTQPGHWRAG